jgi:hypothetical protein
MLNASAKTQVATRNATGTNLRSMSLATMGLPRVALSNDAVGFECVASDLLSSGCDFFADLCPEVETYRVMGKWFLGLVIIGCLLLVILLGTL